MERIDILHKLNKAIEEDNIIEVLNELFEEGSIEYLGEETIQ
jgi:hypothetical protein